MSRSDHKVHISFRRFLWITLFWHLSPKKSRMIHLNGPRIKPALQTLKAIPNANKRLKLKITVQEQVFPFRGKHFREFHQISETQLFR